MKCKSIIGAWLALTTCNVYAQDLPTGLIFDDESYESEFRIARGLDFTDLDTVSSFSLRSYAPKPGNQGKMYSCVSWASGYAALTIGNRVAGNDISPRSPLYIFNQISDPKDCNKGSKIGDALKFLQEKGACAMAEFSPAQCDSLPGVKTSLSASSYIIKDFYTLFGMNDIPLIKIKNTITSLTSGKPVIAGLQIFNNLMKIKSDGNYKPDETSGSAGGHAMCVVGFDKVKKQFEILNSWGPGWGDKGYCYISFDDYAKYAKYAYCMNADTKRALNFTDSKVELRGEFVFKKLLKSSGDDYKFEEIKPVLNNGIYSINGKCNVNDFYKLVAQNTKENTFLYIFSFKPNQTSELLFPRSEAGIEIKDVPIITSGKVKVTIPENPDNAYTTDQAGSDYLCILYSDKRIDNISTLVKSIQTEQGSVSERIQTVFGKKLIPQSDITYANDLMRIEAVSEHGYIAPIILNVNVSN